MLERLHAHREWANQRILDWYLELPRPEEYCLKMLSHILLGEETWLRRIHGEPNREVWQTLRVEELKPLGEANNAGWRDVLRSDLSRRVHYRRLSDGESESTLADIAAHLCTNRPSIWKHMFLIQISDYDSLDDAGDILTFSRIALIL